MNFQNYSMGPAKENSTAFKNGLLHQTDNEKPDISNMVNADATNSPTQKLITEESKVQNPANGEKVFSKFIDLSILNCRLANYLNFLYF